MGSQNRLRLEISTCLLRTGVDLPGLEEVALVRPLGEGATPPAARTTPTSELLVRWLDCREVGSDRMGGD